jgi:hypothetical protein
MTVILNVGCWCWLEAPVISPGFGAGPVFLTEIKPLKTGNAFLRLKFVQAIHPIASRERDVVLRVIFRGDRHLAGTFKDHDGEIRTAILSAPDYAWLDTYCPILMRRRPPSEPSFTIVGKPPLTGPGPMEHLDAVFGRTPDQILLGATARSFDVKQLPMPRQHRLANLDRTFGPFDSWMIARGFVPREMEEKWFIYMENGQIFFRRSWTGVLIYKVEAAWRDDQLYLGQVIINRNKKQYTETDDEYDIHLLIYIIAVVLLGEYMPFPHKAETSPEQAALQAWSIVGKSST